jgi:hypothetical protein
VYNVYSAATPPSDNWHNVFVRARAVDILRGACNSLTFSLSYPLRTQPVSAIALRSDSEKATTPTSAKSVPRPESVVLPRPPGALARLNPFARRGAGSLSPVPSTTPQQQIPSPVPTLDAMQVTMLIAMPDLRRYDKPHDEDEELPEMVLGTAAIPYRGKP